MDLSPPLSLSSSPSTTKASPPSTTGSTASSSHYYQRRFDGTRRRHELLEKLARNSPSKSRSQSTSSTATPSKDELSSPSTTAVTSATGGPPIPDPTIFDNSNNASSAIATTNFNTSINPHLSPRINHHQETTSISLSSTSKIESSYWVDASSVENEKKMDGDEEPVKEEEVEEDHGKRYFNTPQQQPGVSVSSLQSQHRTERCDGNDDGSSSIAVNKRYPLHLEEDVAKIINKEEPDCHRQQQKETESSSSSELRYYRIVYRGVVALLADPFSSDKNARGTASLKKSGAYLSYGEIIASGEERLVEDTANSGTPSTPNRRKPGHHENQHHPSPRLGSAVSSPILSQVWEEHQRTNTHDNNNFYDDEFTMAPSSPPRSLVSGTGSVSSLETMRTASTSMVHHHPAHTETSSIVTATTAATTNNRMRKVIRVDRVLTGGYAVDATEDASSTATDVKAYAVTPKRGNHMHHNTGAAVASHVIGPTTVSLADAQSVTDDATIGSQSTTGPRLHLTFASLQENAHGYIFSEQCHIPIAIPLQVVPKCEQGSFLYRVISSTPLSILTGPCSDAPKTKAILIPGTVHEVCLRVQEVDNTDGTSVVFLRLTRRRGWVADRKPSIKGKPKTINNNSIAGSSHDTESPTWVQTMKEISNEEGDECALSVTSRVTSGTITSAVATPISAALGRHRPPRRRRDIRKDVIDPSSLPRHVLGPTVGNFRNNDTSALTDTSMIMNTGSSSQHDPRTIISPSSNISLLSDESSSLDATNKSYGGPTTPDRSVARSVASSASNVPSFFLMRVNAPRGLKILDAPHFQVNNLIHGTNGNVSGNVNIGGASSSSPMKELFGQTGNQSIFQTMAGHHTTTMTSKISNPAVFDSIARARKLPRGSVFEASKRMEASNAFNQGAGLIKLSDNSGWAIVPRQDELDDQYRNYSGALAHTKEGEATRAFEEVGNAMSEDRHSTIFLRVLSKGGVSVSLPPIPSTDSDVETSPTSSTTGSSAVSGANGTLLSQVVSQDSDVASSVGSSFLDAVFRTPKKKSRDSESHETRREYQPDQQNLHQHRPPIGERQIISTVIPCGMCVEVDRWVDPPDMEHYLFKNEFARLRGGQGWIPRFVNGKPVVETISPPEFRVGSFWFRVQDRRGIKVRLGPSRRAPSIKSDDGVYFRFECGEYLRASEIVTFFRRNSSIECFAKLYRNRHARLHAGHGEVRSLASLTVQAEWVQAFGDGELYLEECATEPRIERHRQGWRYNVVLDTRVAVRRGPSFEAETVGVVLLGGESVLINERVTGPDDTITWLRLKDGQGWVHNYGQHGESLMIPHSLRHRSTKTVAGRPSRPSREGEEIAYNTIIARLFHSDIPGDSSPSKESRASRSSRR